jgi:hypothetical protein
MSCCNKTISNISTGTGLNDGFPPGGVDAHDVRLNLSKLLEYKYIYFQANQFMKKLPYDIMAIGKSVVITTRDITPLHNSEHYSF